MSGACAACGQSTTHKCGGCNAVFYCSKEHQKKHWSIHKSKCPSYKIDSSAELGRFLIASRDIPSGDVVLMEAPLVVAPKQFTTPLCLSCYADIDGSYRCSKCNWPLCSAECESKPAHAPECSLVQKGIGKVKFQVYKGHDNPTYQSIAVMRCLSLRDTDKEGWEKLLSLESHDDKRKGTPKFQLDLMNISKFLREYIQLDQFSEEQLMRMSGILDVNSFEIPIIKRGSADKEEEESVMDTLRAIYPTGCLVEHSCLANSNVTFDDKYTLLLRAVRPIKKGEHLCLMYSDPLWCTHNRESHLSESKYFRCSCPRCVDPSELGTYLGGIRCPCEGVLVPQSPLKDDSVWKCEKCSLTKSAGEVTDLSNAIGKELIATGKNVEDCEAFLQKNIKILHPHHQYIMDVKRALIQMYGRVPGKLNEDMSEEEMRKKELYCRDTLEVINKILPGISKLKGLILYELADVLLALGKSLYEKQKITRDKMQNYFQEIRDCLLEVQLHLKYSPPSLMEGHILANAKQELEIIDMYIKSLSFEIKDGSVREHELELLTLDD